MLSILWFISCVNVRMNKKLVVRYRIIKEISALNQKEVELVRILYDEKAPCCNMECTCTIPAEIAVRTREQFLESTKEERNLIMMSIMEACQQGELYAKYYDADRRLKQQNDLKNAKIIVTKWFTYSARY